MDRLEDIISIYLAAAKAGKPPNKHDFLAQYPEWRAELGELFSAMRFADGLEKIALTDSNATSQSENSTVSHDAASSKGGGNSPPIKVSVPGHEILRVLGRGGMGVVYLAKHLKLGRQVALKMVLGGEHAGAAALVRFEAEARAVAPLQHPNIVQIYEIGETDFGPFLSMAPARRRSTSGRALEAGGPADPCLPEDSRCRGSAEEASCPAASCVTRKSRSH